MSQGRVEQTGAPSALYDDPANEFVMTSTGPVTRIGSALVRPHDVEVHSKGDASDDAVAAIVERVARLGFEVRAILRPEGGGEPIGAQLTRAQADALELSAGQRVHVRAARAPAFAAAASGPPQALVSSRCCRSSWAASSTSLWRHSAARYWYAIRPMRWTRRKSP